MNHSVLTFVFLSIHLLSLILCEHSFKTINFVQNIISSGHQSRFNEIKNIHLPIYDVSSVAHVPLFSKANVTNLVGSHWGSPEAIKRFGSKRANNSAKDESMSILKVFAPFVDHVYAPIYQWERFLMASQKPIFVMTEILYSNYI